MSAEDLEKQHLAFEKIGTFPIGLGLHGNAWRWKVPGGWILRFVATEESFLFYADPTHEWNGRNLP